MKKLMVMPTRRNGLNLPPPKGQIKSICLIQGYYKGYGSHTHDRPYVMEYEEDNS